MNSKLSGQSLLEVGFCCIVLQFPTFSNAAVREVSYHIAGHYATPNRLDVQRVTHEAKKVSIDHMKCTTGCWDDSHLRDWDNVDNATQWKSEFVVEFDHDEVHESYEDGYHGTDDGCPKSSRLLITMSTGAGFSDDLCAVRRVASA